MFAVMEMVKVSFVITVFALFLTLVLPSITAQAPAPAPVNDGLSSLYAHTTVNILIFCFRQGLRLKNMLRMLYDLRF